MKKILTKLFSIISIFILGIFVLASCGNLDDESSKTKNESSSVIEPSTAQSSRAIESSKQDPYYVDEARTLKVVKIEGSATVTDEYEQINCYTGMNVYAGDTLDILDESLMVLKLDSDKYVYFGENTTVRIKSEGKENSRKTNIFVEKGKVLAEVQNKLGEDEEFFLSSNNSVMAVRGTLFGVDVKEVNDEIVESYSVFRGVTELYVFDYLADQLIEGKLSDITNNSYGKIIIRVPKDKIIENDKFENIISNWLRDVDTQFDDKEDANEKLNQVQIEVTPASPADYIEIVEKINEEIKENTIQFKSQGYFGPYDGNAHKISVTPNDDNANVYYKLNLDDEYTTENNFEFIAPGNYRVYYKITCEGYPDVEDFEVIYITKPNIIITSDYINYDDYSKASILDISTLSNEYFNKYNGVLASEILKNANYFINDNAINANNITVDYNKIINNYIELKDGKNTLSVTFEFDNYSFTTNVDFIFSDTREDLGYDIAVSNDYLENLSGSLYFLQTNYFQESGLDSYTIDGTELLTMFGLDLDDPAQMLINYIYDIINESEMETSNATTQLSLSTNVFLIINFLIFPTSTTKGFNETIYLYVGEEAVTDYPSYEIKNLDYGYNATKTPNGVLMDFVSSDYTVLYSLDAENYTETLYITDAGSHKVYYKVTNQDVSVEGYEYVNVTVGQGDITFDNIKFINEKTIYLFSNDNFDLMYSYTFSETFETYTKYVTSSDGRTITNLDDVYLIYTNLIKNSIFYDSITKEAIDATVTVSEKKDDSADFTYIISADGYSTVSGMVNFDYSQIGHVSAGKNSSVSIQINLPTDVNVKFDDTINTIIPSYTEFNCDNIDFVYQVYYSIDSGKTWSTSAPKITEAGAYQVYSLYCLAEKDNNTSELIPDNSIGLGITLLSSSGNFIVTIQNIVVE